MRVYLASPGNQLHAHLVQKQPVLMSFGAWKPFLAQYMPTWDRVLIDSGAFSEINSGVAIDGAAYRDWYQPYEDRVDAVAGLDNISGDWRQSLKNYEQYGGFPTFHDTDPPELLPDLIDIARERGRWIGIGLKPPREGKEDFVRRTLDRMPHDLHVHGWALRRYRHLGRLDSMDSTNWWRDAMKIRTMPLMDHLSYGEALEIIIKRYARWQPPEVQEQEEQISLFSKEAN
tara:strand:+ start:404 stop:1093 length:690 start_codon:yes stop_codon:yes gene_type:complete